MVHCYSESAELYCVAIAIKFANLGEINLNFLSFYVKIQCQLQQTFAVAMDNVYSYIFHYLCVLLATDIYFQKVFRCLLLVVSVGLTVATYLKKVCIAIHFNYTNYAYNCYDANNNSA